MPPKAGKSTNHKCGQCDKSFPTKRELILHQYIHQEKPNTTCSPCNRTFPNELSFRRHMRIHTDKLKRSKICQICKGAFENNHELDKHHREQHLKDKRFRCNTCGVEFSWQENLRKHMRMHKPDGHVCQTCHRSFDDMTSLRLHVKQSHEQKPDNDKPYICNLCQRAFKYDFSYEAHLNAHQVPSPGSSAVPTPITVVSHATVARTLPTSMGKESAVRAPVNSEVQLNKNTDASSKPVQIVKQVVQPDKKEKSTDCDSG